MASSSDNILLSYIKQTVYGAIPVGNFTVFRGITESLSGDPTTKEADEITGDNLPTGQLVTGLDLKGDLNGELAPTKSHADFIAAAMRSAWGGTITTGALALTINTTAKTISRAAGSFVTDGFKVNDFVQLSNFTNGVNNEIVQLSSVSALSVGYIGPITMVNETGGATTTMVRPNFVQLGSTDTYFTMEKKFTDLTNKSLLYQDWTPNDLMIDLKYGSIAMVKFGMVGMDDKGWTKPATPFTNTRTIDPVSTELALNCSADVGVVWVDGAAVCLEGLSVAVNHNRKPANCLGTLAPKDQVAMQPTVDVKADLNLTDTAFNYLDKKMFQTPMSVLFPIRQLGKGYAIHIPAVQFSIPDPKREGKGNINKLSLTGKARKDSTMGNALRIYAFGASA
jgi:hypothetical protein